MIKSAPLKSLYTFIAVAETGSMVLAAEQLSISHSAVSQSIKALESQLILRYLIVLVGVLS
ncbi:helix-turn-helix domain-containing protein [Pseudoalteromonas espejiana]